MKRRALLVFAVTAAVLAGCAATPPPVSEKVQSYYDSHKSLQPIATQAQSKTVAFIGDSYSAGMGATNGGWTALVARDLNLVEKNFALGGTGYVATAGQEGCRKDFCPNYAGVADAVISAKPDFIVVSGGRNDTWVAPADLQAAASALFQKLRAGLPSAKIIVTSPLWDSTEVPAKMQAVVVAVKTAADSTATTYADLGQPLSGKLDQFGADHVHPNDAGYRTIADAAEAKLKPLLPAQ